MTQSRPSRACLILASGMGRRMGGPKALLLWQGVPLAVAHARARRAQCDRVVVVTRDPIARVLLRAEPALAVVVSQEADELGPAGSIMAAVQAGAIVGVEQVLVTPVDVAPSSTALVEALWAALSQGQASRPRLRGLPGHPVACAAGLLRSAYQKQAAPLRDLLASLGSRCIDVDVDDEDVLADFDTIEAFEATTGRKPDFWR
jgi:molybdopterin-guanine dinucleotide biosynthesis protein A